MGGGTEAFPNLGLHCQKSDCQQLDFLPFTCNACHKAFCLEHQSCKSHACPKSDAGSRKVVVCEICSAAIETTGCDGEDEKRIMDKHEKSSDCDPKKKKKPTCPVPRCKEVLTFSNTASCKACRVKTCLRHRFPADHACRQLKASTGVNKFLAGRSGRDCGSKIIASGSQPSVKACRLYSCNDLIRIKLQDFRNIKTKRKISYRVLDYVQNVYVITWLSFRIACNGDDLASTSSK